MNTAILLLFIGGTVLTLGDITMKKWVNTNSHTFYIAGLIVWLVGLMFLAQSFKYKNMAVASTIFVIFNVVTLSIVSWLYFKETLSTFQILGVIIGLVAIIVMEIA